MKYISFYKHIVMVLFIGMLYSTQEEINFYADSWALLIGINEYQFEKPLNYAVADAKEMQRLLVEKLGFPEQNIEILLDDNATLNGIKKSMQKLAEQTSENDRVLIYFAGHGMTQALPSGGEEGYLIPINGKSSDLFSTSIAMSEMQRFSNMTPAKDMLFLMDACYSGLMGVGSRGLTQEGNSKMSLRKIAAGGSRTVITAGRKGEIAQERAQWGHSPFVKNITSGLDKGMADSNGDGYVTDMELGNYLAYQVTADTDNKQTPIISHFTTDQGQFVFILEDVNLEMNINVKEGELDEIKELVRVQQTQVEQLMLLLAEAQHNQQTPNIEEVEAHVSTSSEDVSLEEEKTLEKLEDELKKFEAVMGHRINKMNELEDEMSELEDEMIEAEEMDEGKEKNVRRIDGEMGRVEKKMLSTWRDLESIKEEMVDVELEIDKLKEQQERTLEKLEFDMEELEAELEELEYVMDYHSDEMDELEDAMIETEEMDEGKEKNILRINRERTREEKEIKKVKIAIVEVSKEMDELETEINKLKNPAEDTVNDLINKLKELGIDIESVEISKSIVENIPFIGEDDKEENQLIENTTFSKSPTYHFDEIWARYNRSEGFYLQLNKTVQSEIIPGSSFYGGLGRAFHRNEYQWIIGYEHLVFHNAFQYYFEAFNKSITPDAWRVWDGDNSLSAFFLDKDYLDWYRGQGFRTAGFIHIKNYVSIGAEYNQVAQSSMNNVLVDKIKDHEKYNIQIGDNNYLKSIITLGYPIDIGERKKMQIYSSIVRTQSTGNTENPYTYDHLFLNLLAPYTSDLNFNLKILAGASDVADSIWRDNGYHQNIFEIGGEGTLRGYGWKELYASHYFLTTLEVWFGEFGLFYDQAVMFESPGNTFTLSLFDDLTSNLSQDIESSIGIVIGDDEFSLTLARPLNGNNNTTMYLTFGTPLQYW